MGKSAGSAPAPDPQIGAAALKQAKTGEDWLNFAKESFAVSTERQKEIDDITKKVTEQQLGLATDQAGWAKSDRERYETVFKPVEDEFIDEASNYATQARQSEAAAEARADVKTAAASAQAASLRDAASLGINPASGRFAGVRAAGDMGITLAEAGAANNARTMVRDKGLALKADVANLGRGLPTQSAQAASVGLSAGNSALGGMQGANAQYLASTNIMNSGYAGAGAGYAGQASTLNQQYGLQLEGWKTEQEMRAANASGIGNFVGGMAKLFMSDENVKHNKDSIPDGDALDAVNSMPIEEWTYNEGVADGGRHVGPYAQDMAEATGKGDGKTILAQDAIGLTMRAVQDLSKQVEKISDVIGLGGVGPTAANNNVKPAPGKKRVLA